jgi:L,D-transpeptidase catalytic domain
MAVGTCINSTGEDLLVYGDKTASSPPDRYENTLYRLPPGRKTPPGWDCDGIYIPNDRIGVQVLGADKQEPVAVKYGLGIADITFEIKQEGNKYILPGNQGVFAPSEVCCRSNWPTCVCWDIPDKSHSQLSSYPEVPGNLFVPLVTTKRIQISLNSEGRGQLECVGFGVFNCLGKKDAPYKTDVTVTGTVDVDKFPIRLSVEFNVDLNWVIVMDGNRGFWIHEGDISRRSSAGCVNLVSEDAKKVYDWVDGRTRITITAPWLDSGGLLRE